MVRKHPAKMPRVKPLRVRISLLPLVCTHLGRGDPDKIVEASSILVTPTNKKNRGIHMGNVQAIPGSKKDHASADRAEFDAFRNGDSNLREKGILNIPNAYDPDAGSKYRKNPRPVLTPGPLLATDPGQPSDLGTPRVISREVNRAIDKPEGRVVRSKGAKR